MELLGDVHTLHYVAQKCLERIALVPPGQDETWCHHYALIGLLAFIPLFQEIGTLDH